MRLVDYLEARRESARAFAARAGIPHRTVLHVVGGRGCHIETALAIISATHSQPTPGGGTVALDDLIEREAQGGAA